MESSEVTVFSTGDCRLISLPYTSSGAVESCMLGNSLPFAVRRIFYIYGINSVNQHPGHAHLREQQAIIAIKGSFDISVSDGADMATFHLDKRTEALYIPSGIWCSLSRFTPDTVCLVFSSTNFDAADYIRDYAEFAALRRCPKAISNTR